MNDRIEKVAMYRASDGSLHESEDLAVKQNNLSALSDLLLEWLAVQNIDTDYDALANAILDRFKVEEKPQYVTLTIGGAVDKRA